MTSDPTTTQDSRMACETLKEAERVAHICAAYQQLCGLACDAYHRVLLDTNADQAAQARELVMLAADTA
ncbi:MAG: hypothetical protein ACLP01_22735 [Solirubrobacteraceae bacterium]